MLSVENVDLHYGAAIALRQVSLTAEIGALIDAAPSAVLHHVSRGLCAAARARRAAKTDSSAVQIDPPGHIVELRFTAAHHCGSGLGRARR